MARKANTKIMVSDSADTKPRSNSLRVKIDDLQTFDPLTENQRLFFDAYKRGDYFVALHGVAGTGKTFCALYKAIEEVLDKSNPFNKIIVVRSAVQSREIGHLPGDVNEKMEIYQQPYRQI
jgi:predicted ribonuclease YlaK